MTEKSSETRNSGLSYFWLAVSVLASILVWGWLFNYKMAIVLVVSLLVHESGHYYWMGREGIKKRKMMMIPPFGAIAMSGEPFPGYAAENRIALAGPGIGLAALFGFYFLLSVTGQSMWAAAVVITAYINLLNLIIPISVLDGGRVIKSTLFSLNYYFGMVFAVFGLAASVALGIYVSPIGFLIAYGVWREIKNVSGARKDVEIINAELQMLKDSREITAERLKMAETLIGGEGISEEMRGLLRDDKDEMSRLKEKLDAKESELASQKEIAEKAAYPTLMTGGEILIGLGSFVLIIGVYFYFLNLMSQYVVFSPLNISDLIKYFN